MKTPLFRYSALSALALLTMATLGLADELVSPFTNATVRSEFQEASRDPFSPVGYVRPLNSGPVKQEAKPTVNFKLKVTGISMMGTEVSATLDNGQIIEPGGTYPFKATDGKTTVTYKVVRITEDSVIANFEDKDYEFTLSNQSLDMFKEKEE